MYIAQTTKDRIKLLSKERKINVETMLTDCSLGVNAVRQISNTKGMASFSLAKIADYLDCSVDYLLGRTDTPNHSNELKQRIASYDEFEDYIIDAYGELTLNTFNLYTQLDSDDQGEIRGEMKHMLKARKYFKEESKNA